MIRSITKPRQCDGLSHIKVPARTDNGGLGWESIYKPANIKAKILQQHKKHFSQAGGSAFTMEPLKSLINDKCTSQFAWQILNGTADIESLDVNNYTKSLLQHLKT